MTFLDSATRSIRPISPDDVVETKKTVVFPPQVIEAWNYLIAKHYLDGRASIMQDEVVKTLIKYLGLDESDPASRRVCYDNKYLDIEDIYRAEGWTVEYDKPAFNETYEPSFIFRKGKRR